MGLQPSPYYFFSSVFRSSVFCILRASSGPRRRRLFATFSPAMASLQRSALFEAIQKHDPHSVSIVHSVSGRTFRYGSLLHDVAAAKERLLQQTGRDDKSIVGERVAFLAENSYDYVGAHFSQAHDVFSWSKVLILVYSHPSELPRCQRHCGPSRTFIPCL